MVAAKMTPRERRIHNEQTKATANFLANTGMSVFSIGVFAPIVMLYAHIAIPPWCWWYCAALTVVGIGAKYLGLRWLNRLI